MMTLTVAASELKVAYPQPYTLFQRDTATSGIVRIRGASPADKHPERIEARLGAGAWQVVDARPGRNTFAGPCRSRWDRAPGSAGPGGDRVGGECGMCGGGRSFPDRRPSNADGRGEEWVKLDPANPYVGVKYLHNTWSQGDDPSANDTTPTATNNGSSGSPWPIVLNRLIPDQKVRWLRCGCGRQHRRRTLAPNHGRHGDERLGPGGMYARALDMVKEATDGSLKIKAVLYYQGESDLGVGIMTPIRPI